jgi:hypothetical protein
MPQHDDMSVKTHFADFFEVSPLTLDKYGAFNVSLINDLPLFIDPFLLFNSSKPEYRELHDAIIRYVLFLKDKSVAPGIRLGLLEAWFTFPEVRQNWLGFSKQGNGGSGLGPDFAKALNRNLRTVFTDFGTEQITRGSHLEKLCLIKDGIGRDNISDFTTNLIKDYLLRYTQTFAVNNIAATYRRQITVNKVAFNYETETWQSARYELPFVNGDYVILTPKDILTKDDTWISRADMLDTMQDIADAISDAGLRSLINAYLLSTLSRKSTRTDEREVAARVVERFPEVLDWYIKHQEESGPTAVRVSREKVGDVEQLLISQVNQLARELRQKTAFYEVGCDTYDEAYKRLMFFKDVIENKGGHRLFYLKGKPIPTEVQLHILYRLTWYGTPSDVSREVNDGRGPVDFKISHGAADKSLVEFKLASNSQLKRNLQHQVGIYEKASDANRSIKVIVFFTAKEVKKVRGILDDLNLKDDPSIVLIDACRDNKPSASKA